MCIAAVGIFNGQQTVGWSDAAVVDHLRSVKRAPGSSSLCMLYVQAVIYIFMFMYKDDCIDEQKKEEEEKNPFCKNHKVLLYSSLRSSYTRPVLSTAV